MIYYIFYSRFFFLEKAHTHHKTQKFSCLRHGSQLAQSGFGTIVIKVQLECLYYYLMWGFFSLCTWIRRDRITMGTIDNFCPKTKSIFFLCKVHIFWEGHKILRNLYQLFVLCTASQIIGGDFTKFCGLLRIYEL